MTSDKLTTTVIPTLENAKDLQDFLREPLPAIIAGVTGALAMGRPDFVLAGGRLVQAAVKRKLFEQAAKEIQLLIKKGKLKEDYTNEPFGYRSLLELLEFIDSEVPEEERLRGVQAMFYAINDATQADAQRVLNYQIFRLAKLLSGSQMKLLATLNKSIGDPRLGASNMEMDPAQWALAVAGLQGHNLPSLIEIDEETLTKYKLISSRHQLSPPGTAGGGSRPAIFKVNVTNGRLTDLGARFCWCLQHYDKMKHEIEPPG